MPRASASEPEVLPLREICDRYEGEWLLIKILDASIQGGDVPAQLLARSLSRNAMFKAERKFRKQEPRALLTILGGGTKVR